MKDEDSTSPKAAVIISLSLVFLLFMMYLSTIKVSANMAEELDEIKTSKTYQYGVSLENLYQKYSTSLGIPEDDLIFDCESGYQFKNNHTLFVLSDLKTSAHIR